MRAGQEAWLRLRDGYGWLPWQRREEQEGYQRRLLQTSLLQQQEQGATASSRRDDGTTAALVAEAQARVQQQAFGEFISQKWAQVARL